MADAPVQSLHRAIAILGVLSDERRALGVTEIATRLDLAKSTIHRLLSGLEASGLLTRSPEGKYRLGLRLWEWGCAAVSGLNVRDAARPIMEDLVQQTGETVHLSVWDQGDAVYIDRLDGTNPIRLHSTVGGRAPAHATASGLALLAFQDETLRAQAERHLPRYTARTLTSGTALRRRLEEVRRQGYAFSVGAWYEGSAGVAAPIRSHTGGVGACLSVAGPAERIVGRVPELAGLVTAAAARVSRALGAPGDHKPTPSHVASRRSAPAPTRRGRDGLIPPTSPDYSRRNRE